MNRYFLDCTNELHDSIVSLHDFVLPTATALWNFRQVVQQELTENPTVTALDLAKRFNTAPGTRGSTNLITPFHKHQWEVQRERLAEVSLVNVIALYEIWCDPICEVFQRPDLPLKLQQLGPVAHVVATPSNLGRVPVGAGRDPSNPQNYVRNNRMQSDGVRLRLPFDYIPAGDGYRHTADMLSAALATTGIMATVRSQNFSTYVKRFYTERDLSFSVSRMNNMFDSSVGVQRVYRYKNSSVGCRSLLDPPDDGGRHFPAGDHPTTQLTTNIGLRKNQGQLEGRVAIATGSARGFGQQDTA